MPALVTASTTSRMTRKRSATRWLRPYYAATAGGEAAMLRYLDDPDVPCYATGWLKADKNRFHQERAPGSAKKYVFNPSSWVYAFRNSLTAVSIAAEAWGGGRGAQSPGDWWGCKRGVTLITPRHVLCSHGGVQVGSPEMPTRWRFVGTDGETYERFAIGVRGCSSYTPLSIGGVSHAGDSTVLTLNAELPAAVIPMRCIPNDPKFKSSYGTWDGLFVSQSIETDSPTPTEFGEQSINYPGGYYPPADFPRRHRSMCCLPWSSDPKVGYQCWGGDSGMPLLYGYGSELLFAGFAGGGGIGANNYPKVQSGVTITWEALINAMILLSDTNAGISPTGYTVTLASEIPALLP